MPTEPPAHATRREPQPVARARSAFAGLRPRMRSGPRAAIGGTLCGIAALGLWWAFEQSAAPPSTSFAVARTHLTPGRVIERGDLELIAMRLPAAVEATVFGGLRDDSDAVMGQVVGQVAADAVAAGELLARSDVAAPLADGAVAAGRAISVALERPQALNGLVAAGERVDVVATGHDGANAGSAAGSVIAADALVLDLDDAGGADGAPTRSSTVTVTLAVADLPAALAVAAAADAGAVTLIRAWSIP